MIFYEIKIFSIYLECYYIIYLEVYFHVSLYKYTGNIRIDLLIFLFLVTLAVGKTLLEVVICEFLNNSIFIFTFNYYFLLFFYFFIQNFENKIYMFRYLNNPSANTMKPLQ